MASAFSVTLLGESLSRLLGDAPARAFCVAFSGGADSTALLHAMSRLRDERGFALRGVHVNHHLHPQADEWAAHCREFAARIAVPLEILDLSIQGRRGESVEAAARAARYAAIARMLAPGEHLITAHHRDDQLETILLRLVRGAGVAGMAGMPAAVVFGDALLLRPLLGVEHQDLVDYCRAAHQPWIEDSSNTDPRFDRNFVRQRMIPVLRERWPAVADCVARSGRHVAEAQALLDERAREDLALARDGEKLRASALRALSPARARNLLRFWIEGANQVIPSSGVLEQIFVQMLHARRDAMPLVVCADLQVRRYRDAIYLCRAPPASPPRGLTWAWCERDELELPEGLGRLRLRPAHDDEPALRVPTAPLRVEWNSRGLRLRLTPRGSRRALRKLFQERGIVPWMRPCLPLLFAGDSLAAVADLWIDAQFRCAAGEPGMAIDWLDRPQLF